jgi:hypothetical protein
MICEGAGVCWFNGVKAQWPGGVEASTIRSPLGRRRGGFKIGEKGHRSINFKS